MKKLSYITFMLISAFIGQKAARASGDLYNFDDSIDLKALASLEIKSGKTNDAATLEKPYLIIVSLDGFRHDYPTLHNAKNIQAMMREGSYVRRLIPAFPSITFPNHYTIATGMYPEHTGLVGNTMYSREKDALYQIRDSKAVRDGHWYNGTPLWSLAERQGMLSASFFWVGSEATEPLTPPSYYFRYNNKVPYTLREQQVEKWLELPEKERPHLIFLYYSITDSSGHIYGPESQETHDAVQYVDARIGMLRKYIKQSKLPINLIVTADHGMANSTNTYNVHDYVDLASNRFITLGPVAMIYTENPQEKQRIYTELLKQEKFDAYLDTNVPEYLNFKNKDRIGDIVLITREPDMIDYVATGEKSSLERLKGDHGYDPYRYPNMSAIFVAEGPNIQSGLALAPTENIHIYPFVAKILGLKVTDPIDGRLEKLAPMLKQK